ncbi:MAG TPA: hypothetical protein VFO60_11125 [Candidatus Dormibacteraeota bacterium]|nr:hypothetical protein [Candidatus Dormibacteraeota bacterium]
MRRADAALVAGYVLAVPPLLRFRSLVRTRNALVVFGVLEVGQVMIAVAWAAKRRPVRAAVNAAAAVAYPAFYVLRGRREPPADQWSSS